MLAQAQEKFLHNSDVKGAVGVEDDDVVEVCSDAVEAFGDLVEDMTNHSGTSLLPCGITSNSKRDVGVQKALRCIVSLCTAI